MKLGVESGSVDAMAVGCRAVLVKVNSSVEVVVLRDWRELVVMVMVMGVVEVYGILFVRLCLVFGAFLVRREIQA